MKVTRNWIHLSFGRLFLFSLLTLVCMKLPPGTEIKYPLSVLERFFKEEMYENFVGTWETARNREVSVLERFDCTWRAGKSQKNVP